MSNKIRIKRRLKGSTDTSLPNLETGELAYDETKGKLYIGESDGGTVAPTEIAGSGYVISLINDRAVPSTRSLTPGSGLFGEDALDFSANRTLNIGQGTGIIIDNDRVNIDPSVRNLTESIVVTSGIGGLSTGTTLTTASGITDVLKAMLQTVFNPVQGTPAPGVDITLSNSILPIGKSSNSADLTSFATNGYYEVGSTGNLTVALSLRQGTVLGSGLLASWNTGASQGPRVGQATAYSRRTNAGTNTDNTTTSTFNNYTVLFGNNSVTGTITHAAGTIPLNSLGETSSTLPQSGTGILSNTIVFYGARRLFVGYDNSSSTAPTTSSQVRSLTGIINFVSPDNNETIVTNKHPLLYDNSTKISVSIPVGTTRVVLAVPSGYYGLSNNITAIDKNAFNADITTGYVRSSVNVSGANSESAIPYNVYSYIPAAPFATNPTHIIKLN